MVAASSPASSRRRSITARSPSRAGLAVSGMSPEQCNSAASLRCRSSRCKRPATSLASKSACCSLGMDQPVRASPTLLSRTNLRSADRPVGVHPVRRHGRLARGDDTGTQFAPSPKSDRGRWRCEQEALCSGRSAPWPVRRGATQPEGVTHLGCAGCHISGVALGGIGYLPLSVGRTPHEAIKAKTSSDATP